MAGLLFLEDNQKRTGLMKRQIICLFACVILIGCSNTPEDDTALRIQMEVLYGENKELQEVPEGQPVAIVENGVFVGQCNDGVLSFKGIPYAKPPVGKLRWHAPQRIDSSSVIREACYFGKSGIQTLSSSVRASYYKQGEDCLTLNVWAASDTTRHRPVMVWIHGGSYGWGGTSDPLFDGHNFVKAHPEVVLVTINYRLGLLGFLDLTQMEGGEDYAESGNLGLLDQVAALEWIQRNIAAFGGEASQVIIFGESAGGGSVSLLTVMPRARGLFQRAIVESGSVALSSTREEHKLLVERVQKATGAKCVNDLMKLSESDLMTINEGLNEYNCFPLRDGIILPLDPYAAYTSGAAKDVDMLMGTNGDEARFWIKSMGGLDMYKLMLSVWFDNVLMDLDNENRHQVEQFVDNRDDERVWNLSEFMTELMFRGPMLTMADAHSSSGGNTFVYYWSYPSARPLCGACHAVEVSYVLNNPQDTIYTGGNVNLALAAEVQKMWVNFAMTGNPSTTLHNFPCYDTASRQCMRLDTTMCVEKDLLSEQRQVVSPLVPLYISPLYCNMSLNVPTIWYCAAWVVIPLFLLVALLVWLFRRRRKKTLSQDE